MVKIMVLRLPLDRCKGASGLGVVGLGLFTTWLLFACSRPGSTAFEVLGGSSQDL